MAQVIRLRRRIVNPYRPVRQFVVRRYSYNPLADVMDPVLSRLSKLFGKGRSVASAKRRVAKRAKNARLKRRRNAGLFVTLGTVNPGKKKTRRRNQVAVKRRKRNRRARAGARRKAALLRMNPVRRVRRRRNAVVRVHRKRAVAPKVSRRRARRPVVVVANPSRRRRRYRNPVQRRRVVRYYSRRANPQLFGKPTGWGETVGVVAASMAGMAMTKFLPTLLPKDWVSGNIGRTLASGATAFLVYVVARDAIKLKGVLPDAVLLGALAQTGSVALNAFLPQVAKPLGFSGMGAFANAQFPVPQNPIAAGYQRAAIAAPVVAPAVPSSVVNQTAGRTSSVSGLTRAFGSAF